MSDTEGGAPMGAAAEGRDPMMDAVMDAEIPHTPGPWEVCDIGPGVLKTVIPGCQLVVHWGAGEEDVAYLSPCEDGEMQANAALLAAAPSLLAAARRVLAGLNARIDAADASAVPVFDGIADLNAAIALATPTPPRP